MSGQGEKALGRPNKVINVPREIRPDIRGHELQRVVTDWKITTGCEVIPRLENGKVVSFDLYGSRARLDAGLRAVNDWLDLAQSKTGASSAWAKLSAFDENSWYYNEVDRMEAERKARFKEPVPEGTTLPFKVTVPWPEEFLREQDIKTPRDYFGSKLETLDPIRFNDEVWISLRSDRSSRVDIEGFSQESVDAAETHYKNLIERARAKSLGITSLNVVLDEYEGTEVVLDPVAAHHWWPAIPEKITPRLIITSLLDVGHFRNTSLHPTTLKDVQEAIQDALDLVRYQRGSYNMSIRFGCIALSGFGRGEEHEEGYIGKKYRLPQFLAGVNGKIKVKSKKWLCNLNEGQQLLSRLMSANYLLEPISVMTGLSSYSTTLLEVRPIFRGTWILIDPNGPNFNLPRPSRSSDPISQVNTKSSGRGTSRPSQQSTPAVEKKTVPRMIVVQIEWTEDEDGLYEKMAPRFYSLDDQTTNPVDHMDVNLFELGQSKVWHFGLESMNLLSKSIVSPFIRSFADSVSIKSDIDIKSSTVFATWKTSPSLKIQNALLEKVYTFGIKETGYRVEAIQMWTSAHQPPCWGIAIRHKNWSSHLMDLERLPVGHGADWNNIIETFLPNESRKSKEAHNRPQPKKPTGKGKELAMTLEENFDSADELTTKTEELAIDDNSKYPQRGIVTLVRKMMLLSQVINNDAVPKSGELGLGSGLVIRGTESLI